MPGSVFRFTFRPAGRRDGSWLVRSPSERHYLASGGFFVRIDRAVLICQRVKADMLISRLSDRAEQRRQAIVAAARTCFLRYGYGKASLGDIANEARISRPLLYLVYKNKEEIFGAVFAALYESRYAAAERILAGRVPTRQKLFGLYEKLVLEPWEELFGMPASAAFFEACERVLPLATAAYTRRRVRYTQALLGQRELAEVFVLAVEGLMKDRPRAALLRKRLQVLVDCFAPAQLPPQK